MDAEVPGHDWEFPEEQEEITDNPEAHPTKLKPSPTLPSRDEVAQHYATHCPYRSWCPICVAASAREDPHRRRAAGRDSESGLPVVVIDYELLEGKITVLIARDLESGATLAYDCESKGPSDSWMIKQFVKDLEDWGRKDVCIKSDGEPAIIAVQSALAEARTGRTVPLNPPAYNPQANGVAEKAVQDVTDIVRRQILGLESRLNKKVEARLPIATWILRHAAWTLTRFQVGHDGMTPWRRLVGRSWNGYLAEMGEQVMGKLALKMFANATKTKRGKKKLEARYIKGTWVGIYPRTGEHILVTTAGDAIRVRTIHRLVEEERWNADVVLAIQSTPRKPCPSAGHADPVPRRVESSEEQFTSGANLEHPETAEWRSCPRELQITERLLGKFGYTPGCTGCTFKENELFGRRPHSVVCRQRIYEKMMQDADEIDRLNRNEARLGRAPDIPRPNASDFARTATAAKPEAAPPREQAQKQTEAGESQSHGGAAESPGTPIVNEADSEDQIPKEDEDDIPDYVDMSDAEDEDEGDAELEEQASNRARAPEAEEQASKRARALALGTTRTKETETALIQMLKSAIEVPSMKIILEDLDKLPETNAPHSRFDVSPEIERLIAIQTAMERLEHPMSHHTVQPKSSSEEEAAQSGFPGTAPLQLKAPFDHILGKAHVLSKAHNPKLAVLIEKRTQSLKPLTKSGDWEMIEAILDSGATATVFPPHVGRGYDVQPSDASKAGVRYEVANGDEIPNLGEKVIPVMTVEGSYRGVRAQIADVSKALQSVRSLVRTGHMVIFGDGEPGNEQHYVLNKMTGETNMVIDDGINYLMRLFVVPNPEAGFGRQLEQP